MGCNVIGENLKDKCKKANVTYSKVYYHKKKNPTWSDEQVIEYVKNNIKDKTLKQRLEEVGLGDRISAVRNYKSSHPEMTEDQIIDRFLDGCKRARNEKSIMFKCEQAGISYSAVVAYKNSHNELDYDTVIEMYKNKIKKEKTLKQRCEELNLSISAVRSYKSKYKMTDDEVIEYFINHRDDKTFKQKCDEAGVKYYDIAVNYRQEHKELSDEQVINEYLKLERRRQLTKEKRRQFKEKCEKHGLSVKDTLYYRKLYKELSDEDIINMALNKRNEVTFAEMCRKYGVNLESAYKYRSSYPDLTDEEVIMHYNKNCYINIFGELVSLE